MHNVGEPCTPDDVGEMMRAVDLDGDGRLDYDEFTKIIVDQRAGLQFMGDASPSLRRSRSGRDSRPDARYAASGRGEASELSNARNSYEERQLTSNERHSWARHLSGFGHHSYRRSSATRPGRGTPGSGKKAPATWRSPAGRARFAS